MSTHTRKHFLCLSWFPSCTVSVSSGRNFLAVRRLTEVGQMFKFHTVVFNEHTLSSIFYFCFYFLHTFWLTISSVASQSFQIRPSPWNLSPSQATLCRKLTSRQQTAPKKFPRLSYWPIPECYGNEKCSFLNRSKLHKHINQFFLLFLSSSSHSPDLAFKAFLSI